MSHRSFLLGAALAVAAVSAAFVASPATQAAPPTPLAAMESRARAALADEDEWESDGELEGEVVDEEFDLEEVEAFNASGVWVEHAVIPGETLPQIAARYATNVGSIVSANGLPGEDARLRSGRSLRVLAYETPPPRQRHEHIVRFGDNWRALAARYGVQERELREWNLDVPRQFSAGDVLTIYSEGPPEPGPTTVLGVNTDTGGLPLLPVKTGGESRGTPNQGRLIRGVQLPENDDLYTVRRPDFAYGSSHMVHHLQLGIARFRDESDYNGELIVSDMSRPRGGRYARHDSHQSGRDADVWLPCNSECVPGSPPASSSQVDWRATWSLITSLIRTGEVQYIFLSRPRQKFLYRAAKAEGFDPVNLGDIIQYPRRARTAIVRHASGHDKHIHVRFRCAEGERYCR